MKPEKKILMKNQKRKEGKGVLSNLVE